MKRVVLCVLPFYHRVRINHWAFPKIQDLKTPWAVWALILCHWLQMSLFLSETCKPSMWVLSSRLTSDACLKAQEAQVLVWKTQRTSSGQALFSGLALPAMALLSFLKEWLLWEEAAP